MIERQELESYVPHKGRMFLLDRVVERSSSEPGLVTQVDVSAQSVFFDPERAGVPVWVAFEYMAQSIAALSGIIGHETKAAEPQIGFIIGVRDFECSCAHFPVGSRLSIRVSQLFRDGPVVSFNCAVTEKDRTLVTAIINAIEADDQIIKSMSGDNNV